MLSSGRSWFPRQPRSQCLHQKDFVAVNPLSVSDNASKLFSVQRRLYGSTARREILPLVGAAFVLLVGRYSWRAMKRMDEEWEEYKWRMRHYEKQKSMESIHDDDLRTIAIDLGTIYAKLASSHPKPEVIVGREGNRSFFTGIIYYGDRSENLAIRGNAALERFYYGKAEDGEKDAVALPFLDALSESPNLSKIIRHVFSPVLQESLERLDFSCKRQVAAIPVGFSIKQNYRDAVLGAFKSDGDDPEKRTVLVPDAVATVWGAQRLRLLPMDDNVDPSKHHTTIVVDVGGLATQLSVVRNDVVVKSLTIPLGGETIVHSIEEHLRSASQAPINDKQSLAALQVQARNAALELSSQPIAKIHVPYLFADPKNHHLDTSISRSTVENLLQSDVRSRIEDFEGSLSRHFPPPSSMSFLFTSVLTELLEQSGQLPASINHILFVGGASRFPLFRQSMKEGMEALMGPGGSTGKLITPETSLASEITVIGAASMIPNYDYDVVKGLQRV